MAAKPVSGKTLGLELCRVLGLDENRVSAISLHADVGSAAVAEVTYIALDTGERFEKRYGLHEFDEVSS